MATKTKGKTALAPTRRRGPSPIVAKLKGQLQAANKRAGAMRAKVKEQNSAGATLVSAGIVTGGGGLAGAIKAFLGDGLLGRGVVGGVGAVSVGAGAFMIPGKAGGIVAAAGAGMLAKLLGDVAEDGLAGMFGSDDGEG